MTPDDGSFLSGEICVRQAELSVILPGGRAILAIAGLASALPRRGQIAFGGQTVAWRAHCWPSENGQAGNGRAGIALVDAPLTAMGVLTGPSGDAQGHVAPSRRVDVSPASLADFARAHGLNGRDVFAYLIATGVPEVHEFAGGFLSLAAEADGFVEILACPETGGLFAQGWAMSLDAGRHRIARLDGDLSLCDAEVATFARDDILSPGRGICLFARDWRKDDFDTLDSLFFEQEGHLRRLEIVHHSVLRLAGAAATQHVAQMLPRIETDNPAAFRRICRPRFQGENTLSQTALPIAMAFDAVFQAPDGSVLASGWLLDPLRRVERVIIKSTTGLYAPLQERWNPIARPDLNDGYAADPRFARLLDSSDTMHGFLASAPATGLPVAEGEVYLELVLKDNACLFMPLRITRLEGRELLPQILATVPLHDPALEQIVEGTLAPFLGQLPARARPLQAATARPIPLSPGQGEVTAIMPARSLAQLQPVMALLADTAEAGVLDLVLVMPRGRAGDAATRLKSLFAFYGLRGRLLLVADQATFAQQIDAGLTQAQGSHVLVWTPAALPATPGWLAALRAEMAALDAPGLISPVLAYEDGSVFYGGDGATETNSSPLLGYPSDWLVRGNVRAMPSGAAQVMFIDREALGKAGGFEGRLYSDARLHHDLAWRLQRAGYGTWCSGQVDFWMLEEPTRPADGAKRMLERVDEALMTARRGRTDTV